MTKLMSMEEAVATFVADGASVLLGAGLEGMIPFAAGHEIIRQRRKNLTLLAPISDMLFDQMIGAGCAATIGAAWVGNVSAGLGHNFRRACERGVPSRVVVRDYSNFTFALALQAAAQGVPFLPTRTVLGSDILLTNPDLVEFTSPFTAERLVAVRALAPDVAFVAVQRADADGGAHCWGALGVAVEACGSCRQLVLVAEEIVDHEIIASDPNRVLAPAFRVSAVVHEPFACHPSPVQGCYGRDHDFYHDYHRETRTADGAERWLARWVYGVGDRRAYLDLLGADRQTALRVRGPQLAAPVDYGA
ncbi:MAG TPA: CoA-transferase [Chloroflexota bacterium]|nr:CoA-transferase [Chloroflexota bacterium]